LVRQRSVVEEPNDDRPFSQPNVVEESSCSRPKKRIKSGKARKLDDEAARVCKFYLFLSIFELYETYRTSSFLE